ncbi:unnamed protein product [Calicophoron daubneyi]|uniref:ADP-ribosylation factor-like protein 2-binding protein n=1 Tax=Calicophoron daubneyi TaxID=300641 RepID=A0AAV2SZD8_CALDB
MEHGDGKTIAKADILNPYEGEELLAGSHEPVSVFDEVIGYLEDIMMSDEFQETQEKFIDENCYAFEDSDENKLCYTEIHQKYVDVVERLIERQLSERMPEFSMAAFMQNLTAHRDELDGEVFDMLYTFTDFLAFKEMMLDHKKAKMGDTVNLELTNSYVSCSPNHPDPLMMLHRKPRCNISPTGPQGEQNLNDPDHTDLTATELVELNLNPTESDEHIHATD